LGAPSSSRGDVSRWSRPRGEALAPPVRRACPAAADSSRTVAVHVPPISRKQQVTRVCQVLAEPQSALRLSRPGRPTAQSPAQGLHHRRYPGRPNCCRRVGAATSSARPRNGLEAARRRGRVEGRRLAVDDDKRAAILARRERGESIPTIAAGVKVSVGVVHKTRRSSSYGLRPRPVITASAFSRGGISAGCFRERYRQVAVTPPALAGERRMASDAGRGRDGAECSVKPWRTSWCRRSTVRMAGLARSGRGLGRGPG
jgi:hypothetical protein